MLVDTNFNGFQNRFFTVTAKVALLTKKKACVDMP